MRTEPASSGIAGLDHVQVAAPPGCGEAARRFYGELLGLEEIEKPPLLRARGGVWFRAGAHEIHVGVADPFVPAAKAHPAFRLATRADLDALAAKLEESSIAVSRADEAEIPGTCRFHALDPWGNRLEFVARGEAVAAPRQR